MTELETRNVVSLVPETQIPYKDLKFSIDLSGKKTTHSSERRKRKGFQSDLTKSRQPATQPFYF